MIAKILGLEEVRKNSTEGERVYRYIHVLSEETNNKVRGFQVMRIPLTVDCNVDFDKIELDKVYDLVTYYDSQFKCFKCARILSI